MNKRTTTDDLADLHDAGVTSGVVNLTGRDVNNSDLKKGFKKVSKPYDPFEFSNPEPTHAKGFLGRPGGWER